MVKWLKILFAGLILLASFGCGAKATPGAVGPLGIQKARVMDQDITPLATPTDLPPTPTETLLPAPELPTPLSLTPVLETWFGPPTASESRPGYYFSVNYDGSLWALAADETGAQALLNRSIPYCKIVPTGGRGLPRGWIVDSQRKTIGVILYDVIAASQNGVTQFINYFGGDGVIVTGFQVSFEEQQQIQCVQMAETVLATLSSVVAPTPTPTLEFTLTPTGTPTP